MAKNLNGLPTEKNVLIDSLAGMPPGSRREILYVAIPHAKLLSPYLFRKLASVNCNSQYCLLYNSSAYGTR